MDSNSSCSKESDPIVSKQPTNSAVVVADYGASSNATFSIGEAARHYQTDLFDCHNCELCFLSFFCYCIANSLIARRMNVFPCYPRCFGVLPLAVRFRTLVGIEENFCLEGCQAWCCPCCFTNRLLSEIEIRGFDLKKAEEDQLNQANNGMARI